MSLDRIFLKPDNKNIFFLDCTRVNGSKELVSRKDINNKYSVEDQISKLSTYFKLLKSQEIIIADDVIYSGSVLKKIIKLFNKYNIKVIGIAACISTIESYSYFNNKLPLGLNSEILLNKNTIDQICERDFYFGIACSGIATKTPEGTIKKAPYFYPYGDPITRASIPKDYAIKFSKNCLKRSIILWQEIERLSQKTFYIKDLPENIINTRQEDEIIYTLKKGLK